MSASQKNRSSYIKSDGRWVSTHIAHGHFSSGFDDSEAEPAIPDTVLTALGKSGRIGGASETLDPAARYEISSVVRLGMQQLRGAIPGDVFGRLEEITHKAFGAYKDAGRGVSIADISAVRAEQMEQLHDPNTTKERGDAIAAVLNIIEIGLARLPEIQPIPQANRGHISSYIPHPNHAHRHRPNGRLLPEKRGGLKYAAINSQILDAVAKRYLGPEADATTLLATGTDRQHSRTRHIAMLLMRELTQPQQAWELIGNQFGISAPGARNGANSITIYCVSDKGLEGELNELKREILGPQVAAEIRTGASRS